MRPRRKFNRAARRTLAPLRLPFVRGAVARRRLKGRGYRPLPHLLFAGPGKALRPRFPPTPLLRGGGFYKRFAAPPHISPRRKAQPCSLRLPFVRGAVARRRLRDRGRSRAQMLQTPPPTPSSERRGNPRGGDAGILLRLTPRIPPHPCPSPPKRGRLTRKTRTPRPRAQ